MHRNPDAMRRHKRHVISELARQAHVSVDEAERVYDEELARLDSQAKVKSFLPVIASRRARETLSRKH